MKIAGELKSGRRVVELVAGFECGTCGIPHLAKNERDVGHPVVASGIEPKSLLGQFYEVHGC
jgi:hypothetical protein